MGLAPGPFRAPAVFALLSTAGTPIRCVRPRAKRRNIQPTLSECGLLAGIIMFANGASPVRKPSIRWGWMPGLFLVLVVCFGADSKTGAAGLRRQPQAGRSQTPPV